MDILLLVPEIVQSELACMHLYTTALRPWLGMEGGKIALSSLTLLRKFCRYYLKKKIALISVRTDFNIMFPYNWI